MTKSKQTDKPLSIILEETRAKTFTAVNAIMQETQLPAFLMDGILSDVLAEVRKQKNLELSNDYASLKEVADDGNTDPAG